jgi:hypothetical protein
VSGWTDPNGIVMCQGEVVARLAEGTARETNYAHWNEQCPVVAIVDIHTQDFKWLALVGCCRLATGDSWDKAVASKQHVE